MEQTLHTTWYKQAVFYEVIVRAFYDSDGDGHGDLRGLMQKLDYLQHLGVDCIWLLPIYPSPLRDDGYDIADYYNVLPTYGTWMIFGALVAGRFMRAACASSPTWCSTTHPTSIPGSRQPLTDRNSPYRDYYVWSDTDQKYKDARIIFLDTEKSNWTWDEQAGQFFWHRFYSSPAGLELRQPGRAGRDAQGDALLAGHGHRRFSGGRGAVPVRTGRHQLRKPA